MKRTFFGTVTDGQLRLSERDRFEKEILPQDGKQFRIDFTNISDNRTLSQNKLLWGVVYPQAMAGFTMDGFERITAEEVHGFFVKRFLNNGETHVLKNGEIATMVGSTKILSKKDFSDYIEKIAMFCANTWNIIISLPT